MTVHAIAKKFEVDRSTVSRWIQAGCPVLELGSVGRGRGSQLDPEAVARWRVGQCAPAVARQSDEHVLGVVTQALLDALNRDDLARRTKTTEAQAALAVLIVFERVYRNLKERPLTREQLPKPLMRLCTIYLDSAERGIIHRR